MRSHNGRMAGVLRRRQFLLGAHFEEVGIYGANRHKPMLGKTRQPDIDIDQRFGRSAFHADR